MTRNTTKRTLPSGGSSDGVFNTPSIALPPYPKSNHSHPDQDRDQTDEDDLAFSDDEMPTPKHTAGGMSEQPLLREDKGKRSGSSDGGDDEHTTVTRRGQFITPAREEVQDTTKQRYIYAALCLLIALVSFVVQTETSVYIQHTLHWNKAYCMLWLTHGSWTFLWPVQLIFLRLNDRKVPWSTFWRKHKALLKSTGQMVRYQDLQLSPDATSRSPIPYLLKTTAVVTTFLTFAGSSWYVAIDLTSPSDLTAIYNCSAFFAYVFSILLLNDKIRWDKMFSVGMAIVGVLVVAYGDSKGPPPRSGSHSGGSTNPAPDGEPDNRLLGNLIIGVGSVLYGLYEVLYKKYACPPEGCSPYRGMVFANTVGSMIGTFTLTVLWIPLPILHFTGLEPFEFPPHKAAWLLVISTLSNATFSGAFLVLMSLTSPVLSSVAALLTIFLVAIVDWMITGKPLSGAAIAGGTLIIVAFLLLSWATYREMQEHAKQRHDTEDKVFDDDDADADFVVDGRDDYEEEDHDVSDTGARKGRGQGS